MDGNGKQTTGLRPGFTPLGIWAFSIGTSIGWGSFIVTCNTYLQKAGVLGTTIGLLLGLAVILVITWNLQYMIRTAPSAGGLYSFEKKNGENDLGFISFWFILMTYMAILWANITSVPLFARFFLGNTFQVGPHYSIFGYEVWFGEALLSMCAVLVIGVLCANSSRLPNYVMIVCALIFAAGFTVCAVIAIARHDHAFSYSPMYIGQAGAFSQVIRIAVISPWAFIGFENIAHFSEEYTFPIKKVRSILISSVIVTTLLYIFVSLLSVSAYPPEYESWLAYIQDMGNLEGIKAVPAFYAADYYLGQTGVSVLMLALLGVILTSLIGNMLALSRLIYAAGREGDAPHVFSKLNRKGIPTTAVLLVIAISLLVPFLGRTAIGWIVDVTTLGATIIYGLISYAVFKHAGAAGQKVEKCTGIIGVALMICFLLLLLIPGLLPFHAMETVSYILFIAWALLGLAYFRYLISKEKNKGYEQHVIVWLILLVLVLFASMMWVSRATENAADEAVQRIYEYHQMHPDHDMNAGDAEDRSEYLQEQADQISSTNMLYTAVSLGLFLLCIAILLNNYRQNLRLGRRLDAAEEEARTAQRIAELKESISALMNNMPAMSFSKDANTGVYLACNQAFAEYAHKESPEGVVGLTDAEIFDEETARHFVEDDRMALSMDKPYVFFEEVPDAAGNQKQFRSTKLKYIDTMGQLCILGMCEDVTEMIRIQRENETTREAYERVRNSGLIYTRLAQTLARGYTDLYYVNLENDEFIEYRTDEENGMLSEVRREGDFFDKCKTDIEQYIHPEDQNTVMAALDRDALLGALNRNRSFVMTYRMIEGGQPFYVTLKASRMEDDENFIILGITNVDEQVKQQKAAERMEEERTAYTRINALIGDFLCIYLVVPDTGRYREYSATSQFDSFGIPKEGMDFFGTSRKLSRSTVFPADLDRFLSLFTKESILAEIERSGLFSLSYRLMIQGKPTHVRLKAAMVEEKDGPRLVVGINDIDLSVRQEEEYARRLSQAQTKASIDALTGVKNKHAYLDAEEQLDRQIAEQRAPAFAISIVDVNDLKKINDTKGHQTGDQYLRDACRIVCTIFKHSPVFRVSGDEFAVISQGSDYENIDELHAKMSEHNAQAIRSGGIVIACGMAKYENDPCVAPVFERADQDMYANKAILKSGIEGE